MTGLITIFTIALILLLGLERIISEYDVDLIIIATASIITCFLFVKDNKRAPTQNESMIYLIFSVIIIMAVLSALMAYKLQPLMDNIGFVLNREFIAKGIALFVEYFIKYTLVIYLPFYFIGKLLAKRYKE
jgi:hypothetical protein